MAPKSMILMSKFLHLKMVVNSGCILEAPEELSKMGMLRNSLEASKFAQV